MVKGITLFGRGITVCSRNKKDHLKRKRTSIKAMDVPRDKPTFFFFNFSLACVTQAKFPLQVEDPELLC